jgi:hypothetical protein
MLAYPEPSMRGDIAPRCVSAAEPAVTNSRGLSHPFVRQCLVAASVCRSHSRSLIGFREIDGELDAVRRYEVQTTADTAM